MPIFMVVVVVVTVIHIHEIILLMWLLWALRLLCSSTSLLLQLLLPLLLLNSQRHVQFLGAGCLPPDIAGTVGILRAGPFSAGWLAVVEQQTAVGLLADAFVGPLQDKSTCRVSLGFQLSRIRILT